MKASELKSERLILRPLSLEHLSESYVNWLNDPEVYRYLESGGDYSIEKLRNFLEEQVNKEILFWAIHLRTTEKHIGNIKIDPIEKNQNSGEYGIMMGDRTEWGKGYAREASWTVINYCFEALNLSQITLGVVENNIKALSLYKSMGFEVTKTIKDKGVYNGKMCNSIRMKLINA